MEKYKVHSFGCKLNHYDSFFLKQELNKLKFETKKNLHVLNSCAVTKEASIKALKEAKRLKKKDPSCLLILTGCAAQVDTEIFKDTSYIDLIIGNSHKGDFSKITSQFLEQKTKDHLFKSNIFKKKHMEKAQASDPDRTRFFLKIQDGCDSFCTFCVIPFARGKSRSLPVSDLVHQINEISNEGIKEVSLTGVHIGDYFDHSTNKNLADLVESILKNTSIQRLRLSSLEPIELSNHLIDLYSDERMCPHFHMSIQSCHSKVLKDMKRKYSYKEVADSFNLLDKKIKDLFISMDLIVGFPTETKEYFDFTYFSLKNLPWNRIHVFPYSQRPKTYASHAFSDSVSLFEKKRRSKMIRDLSLSRYQEKAQKQKGKIKKVLVLKNKKNQKSDLYEGIARDYWPVIFKSEKKIKTGDELEIKISGYSEIKKMEGVLTGQTL